MIWNALLIVVTNKNMKGIIIKKDMEFTDITLKKREIYILNDAQAAHLKRNIKAPNSVEIKDINDLFKSHIDDSEKKNVIIIRSGGIGDLIALSSLALFLTKFKNKNVTIVTQAKYKDLFSWFDAPVKFHDFRKPIAVNSIKFQLDTNTSQLNYEGKIENSNDNWFHIFYKNLKTQDFKFGRPYLCSFLNNELLSQPANIRFNEGILLTLKATANIRSIQLEPIYKALIKSAINIDKIFIHKSNLSVVDTVFIDKINDKHIHIIDAKTLDEFLRDVANARLVISTDTGALHFREGIKRQAIGLYAPFSAECRTKYYEYTHSYNLQSKCPYQPCFQHCQRFDDKCKKQINNLDYPPCTDIQHNKTIIKQLVKIFNNYS